MHTQEGLVWLNVLEKLEGAIGNEAIRFAIQFWKLGESLGWRIRKGRLSALPEECGLQLDGRRFEQLLREAGLLRGVRGDRWRWEIQHPSTLRKLLESFYRSKPLIINGRQYKRNTLIINGFKSEKSHSQVVDNQPCPIQLEGVDSQGLAVAKISKKCACKPLGHNDFQYNWKCLNINGQENQKSRLQVVENEVLPIILELLDGKGLTLEDLLGHLAGVSRMQTVDGECVGERVEGGNRRGVGPSRARARARSIKEKDISFLEGGTRGESNSKKGGSLRITAGLVIGRLKRLEAVRDEWGEKERSEHKRLKKLLAEIQDLQIRQAEDAVLCGKDAKRLDQQAMVH